ncbi:MAG: VOC family protein [Sphingomonadales bacterium]|nr:VOC family protein [Sphingomonadales bacterium]
MGTLQGSWVWYELVTPDPDGAKAFYDAVVGWTIDAAPAGEMDYRMIVNPDRGLTGGVMRLTADMANHGARPIWLGYIGVDNVDASVEAIEAAGGKALLPAFDIPQAGRIAMVADCCGAPFYVMTPTPPPGGGESTSFSSMPNPGRCGWNELYAGNQASAIAFYTGQFGWTLPEPMDMGPMGKYQFIAHDGVTVGAIMQKPEQVPAALWAHYFWVPGIEAAKTRIEANGGQVINGPHEVPGPLWIVQGIDPQGAMFSLVGNK